MADAKLQINPEKSEFCCTEVRYLGFIIDGKGLHADPKKIEAIVNYEKPRNLKQLRRFLGMCGWYSRFDEKFSEDKAPLCHLLKKGVQWHWNPEQESAFERIKRHLTNAPVLVRPDVNKPFSLRVDASDYALGGVLTQEIDGKHHPVLFLNRLMTAAERKWTTTEKECLAVI